MSQFVNSVGTFSDHYQLSYWQKLKLLVHFPLFKIVWLKNHGKGFSKSFANLFYPLIRKYSFSLKIKTSLGDTLFVPVSFDSSDLASFREVFFGNEYGEVLKLKDVKVIFDVGANTGMTSLFFLINLPVEKLIMVEANPSLSERLGFVTNNQRVALEKCAVFGERGHLNFAISENHRDSYIVDDDDNSGHQIVKVETVLLEDIFDKHSLKEVDLLKMDIEGAEHNIIEKTPEVLKKFKNICVEIHGPEGIRGNFRQKLLDLGFDLSGAIGATHPTCETLFFHRRS